MVSGSCVYNDQGGRWTWEMQGGLVASRMCYSHFSCQMSVENVLAPFYSGLRGQNHTLSSAIFVDEALGLPASFLGGILGLGLELYGMKERQ